MWCGQHAHVAKPRQLTKSLLTVLGKTNCEREHSGQEKQAVCRVIQGPCLHDAGDR